MIYPLLPLFVTGLGAGPQVLGIIEGVAETTSSLLKLVSGRLSDRLGRRKPFVVAGYGLSGLARPLMGLAAAPWHVLGIRFTDRVGKGLRTSPRDALIAQAVADGNRGRAFGFHRAMDHLGAVVGPLLATLAFLMLGREETDVEAMREVFFLAAIPAVLAFLTLLFWVREEKPAAPAVARAAPASPVPLSLGIKRYLAAIFVLDLSLSSDAFVLLRASELGVSAAAIPLLWSVHHIVKAAVSTPGGALSDRIGRRRTLVYGYIVYAFVYAGFGFASEAWHAWALMICYGAYFGLTEGTEKALVADLSSAEESGTAFGAYHLVSGLAALPASLMFGYLWSLGGSRLAFLTGAGIAVAGLLLLGVMLRDSGLKPTTS
jgi:MFS family permease